MKIFVKVKNVGKKEKERSIGAFFLSLFSEREGTEHEGC